MSSSSVSVSDKDNRTSTKRRSVAGRDRNNATVFAEAQVEIEQTSSNSRIHPKFRRLPSVFVLFTKNYVLLPLLLLMITNYLIPRLELKNNDVRFLGLNRRIDDVAKSLLQNTTKLIHDEIQFFDLKINKEIQGLRDEVREVIDNNGIKFRGKLNGIRKTIESVEVSLTNEFNMIFEEFRFKNNREHKIRKRFPDDEKILNEMEALLREIVVNEIEKHAADGIARVDYAASGSGGIIVKHSKPYVVGGNIEWLMEDVFGVHGESVRILIPSLGAPGSCFCLKGNSGYVDIRLGEAIIPVAVTLEHVAQSVEYDRSSAPKDCRVFGWLHSLEYDNSNTMVLLTEVSYDLEKNNLQTFDVSEISYAVDTIRLEFTSNHGDPTKSCIYRFRVHGYDPYPLSHWVTQNSGTE